MLVAHLASILAARRARNPRYSLRALARDLRLHHAALSRLLHGRRRPTAAMVRRVGPRLGLGPAEVQRACATADDDAVLAAARRHDLAATSRFIATRAGLPVDDVNASLFRLLSSGRLSMPDQKNWVVHG